jgi:hypothetical protein
LGKSESLLQLANDQASQALVKDRPTLSTLTNAILSPTVVESVLVLPQAVKYLVCKLYFVGRNLFDIADRRFDRLEGCLEQLNRVGHRARIQKDDFSYIPNGRCDLAADGEACGDLA